ncbi:MAG: hypothetical protein COA82_08320 [Alkaliphilus sp.]|jgi:hypothetical protein|nr:MAG: hypothetical protein COA82_08320 [Alkaliphilus sp.]
MWAVVYMANNDEVANRIQELLESEGLLVKVKEVTLTKEEGIREIMILSSEVDAAHNILIQHGY